MTPLAVSTAVWVFILVPLLVVWALGLVDIIRRDLPRGATAAWILIVVLLPFVGTLAYFLLRKPTEKEIEQAQQAAQDSPGGPLGVRQRLPDE
jgi:Phospholipase_D-nuclease N-terminal